MMINLKKYLQFVIVTVLFVSCKVTDQTVPRNLERIYDPSSSMIHPKIVVYNISDSGSLIVERINTNELLFNQANAENKLMAKLKIVYFLYDLSNKQKLVDSLTTTFRFEKDPLISSRTLEIDVNTKLGTDYFIEIITTDQNRNNTQYSFRRIERTKKINTQDFILSDKLTGNYIFEPILKENQNIGIKHYNQSFDSLNVFFFLGNRRIPFAPFLDDSLVENFSQSDTNWVCYLDSMDYSNFKNEGVYYFTTDSEPINGFSLFNFGADFPIVKRPESLIKPLQYLDYMDTISASDTTGKLTKLAVDQFWLDKAKNMDKSRDLLKIFYNRVTLSNMYFTSFKEGWQTDRGMIFIIYGLPDYLFKSGEEEKWIYNMNRIDPGIIFSFKYYSNPFSLNHYILDREKLKSTGWDEAIKMWKNGSVFYFQN